MEEVEKAKEETNKKTEPKSNLDWSGGYNSQWNPGRWNKWTRPSSSWDTPVPLWNHDAGAGANSCNNSQGSSGGWDNPAMSTGSASSWEIPATPKSVQPAAAASAAPPAPWIVPASMPPPPNQGPPQHFPAQTTNADNANLAPTQVTIKAMPHSKAHQPPVLSLRANKHRSRKNEPHNKMICSNCHQRCKTDFPCLLACGHGPWHPACIIQSLNVSWLV